MYYIPVFVFAIGNGSNVNKIYMNKLLEFNRITDELAN